ncbi:MAG: sigma-70 family RNA polymerase sigma factor [Planctomycetota bacterium]
MNSMAPRGSASPELPREPASAKPGAASETCVRWPQAVGDNGLAAGLKQGLPESYELLVRQHGGRMLAVARRLLRNEHDARDALQDAFVTAFSSMHAFRGDSSLGTWLHRIVVNAALMKLRRARSRPEVSIEELLPAFDETGHQTNPILEDWTENQEQAFMRTEARSIVRSSIDRLPETHRTVLMLRDIEELATPEVARLLGITENAVKIRLHRARQALATLLAGVTV